MRISCWTKFDITNTGVTGHLKVSRMPFVDRNGNTIRTEDEWHRARNQQRNWETLQQLISLRAQVFDVTTPVHSNGQWSFEFIIEQDGLFTLDNDPVGILKQDCSGVPMLKNLNEKLFESLVLDPDQNIGFAVLE